ncbi:transcriptional adapter 1-like [Trichogramma pretiosum]|uniref:transcriptional adapter 1-like n=1 Tax=Trichogramma pretiosum TaxID=7493 RepID=UPI0006C9C029|nr:transcriptional adapter 1-like [Trichogramma pretiosum]
MATVRDLTVSRKALAASLGEINTKKYFEKMKLWFQMKSTKEEFDFSVRSMMNDEQVHLHNEFLLSLFHKVRGLVVSTPTRPLKVNHNTHNNSQDTKEKVFLKRKYRSDDSIFEPADIYSDVLSQATSPVGDEPIGANRSSAQELVLPDHTFVLARLMVAAWENNMDGAEDNTAYIIIAATQIFLKNILTAIISRRKGFSVKDGSFIHNLGESVPSIWKRNTFTIFQEAKYSSPAIVMDPIGQMPNPKMDIEDAEQEAAFALACSKQTLVPHPPPICISDVLNTLQIHKNLIKNHTLYATNMERLFTYSSH